MAGSYDFTSRNILSLSRNVYNILIIDINGDKKDIVYDVSIWKKSIFSRQLYFNREITVVCSRSPKKINKKFNNKHIGPFIIIV